MKQNMANMKIRAIRGDSELYSMYVAIDDFNKETLRRTARYPHAMMVYKHQTNADGFEDITRPLTMNEVSMSTIAYDKTDVFLKPTVQMYLLLGVAVKKSNFMFNKKKKKFVKIYR